MGNFKFKNQSLLDVDRYKFTMGQFVWRNHPNVRVKYSFKNRTDGVPLARIIKEEDLRTKLDEIQSTRISGEEVSFLLKSDHIPKGLFDERFLHFLWNLNLPPYTLAREGDQYRIEVEGSWAEAIWWETKILAAVNELATQYFLESSGKSFTEVWLEGERRLNRKIELVRTRPGLKIMEFGTRRRASFDWQKNVLRRLIFALPDQLVGTSNVALAKELGIRSEGTVAHETHMVYAALLGKDNRLLVESQKAFLENWWQEYGEAGAIALTDTYGSQFFLDEFGALVLPKWRGVRQDSGDPFEYGERLLAKYKELGIDARKKVVVFSDGLDVEAIIRLYDYFHKQITPIFGWGTNLTNDLGLPALSIVVKVSEVNGKSAVKLSDNLAKAMGDPEEIERYKEAFRYSGHFQEQCKY